MHVSFKAFAAFFLGVRSLDLSAHKRACTQTIQAAKESANSTLNNIRRNEDEQANLIDLLFTSQNEIKNRKAFKTDIRRDYEIALENGETPIISIEPMIFEVAPGEPLSCSEDKQVRFYWDQI